MGTLLFGKRTALILPLVLATVALLEEIATYKVRQHVRDMYLRAAIVLVLNGAAFAIAATWLSPWLKRMLSSARRTSRDVGAPALWIFYCLAYGGLYYAYFVAETRGPGGLLPLALR